MLSEPQALNGALIHYSEYRSIEAEQFIEDGLGYPGDPKYGKRSTNLDAYNWNKQHFRGASGLCPFCHVPTQKRVNYLCEYKPNPFETNILFECKTCGWWEIERKFEAGGIEGDVAYAAIHHEALAKIFNTEGAEAPTTALVEHLRKVPDFLYGVNKKKMEEIVQYIFSSFYACEVEHCGKSHNGGIDLIMIDSDEPTLIQVKCRERKDCVESISKIREFLGAMWIKQSRKGIYVTTADHYSSVSKRTINQMISEKILDSFEMVDYKRFVEMLNIVKSPKELIWTKLMNETFYLAE